jgi:pimeloyl-ACP methyl ester carboxylesterase
MHALSHIELENGLRMEVEQWGHGDRPLVLVHGYTGSRDDWLEQLPGLSARGLTIALDLRGHGGSKGRGRPDDYTFDQLAEDVVQALDTLGVTRCDLLGHSMGGIVAQLVTRAQPERIASLVLMDTFSRGMALLPKPVRDATRGLVEQRGMAGLADAMEGAARAGRAGRSPAALASIERMGVDRYWARIRAKLLAMGPVAFTTLGDAFPDWPGLAGGLGEIACPPTVLVGEEDAPFRAPSEALGRAIPHATLEVIASAEHSPQIENASVWLTAMHAHLDRARSEAGPRA